MLLKDADAIHAVPLGASKREVCALEKRFFDAHIATGKKRNPHRERPRALPPAGGPFLGRELSPDFLRDTNGPDEVGVGQEEQDLVAEAAANALVAKS